MEIAKVSPDHTCYKDMDAAEAGEILTRIGFKKIEEHERYVIYSLGYHGCTIEVEIDLGKRFSICILPAGMDEDSMPLLNLSDELYRLRIHHEEKLWYFNVDWHFDLDVCIQEE